MHSYLSYSSTNGYRIRRVVKLWVHSMKNSASPTLLGDKTNTTNEVRKHILLHLLTYKGNENAANIPEGVRDYLQRYISLTNKKQ